MWLAVAPCPCFGVAPYGLGGRAFVRLFPAETGDVIAAYLYFVLFALFGEGEGGGGDLGGVPLGSRCLASLRLGLGRCASWVAFGRLALFCLLGVPTRSTVFVRGLSVFVRSFVTICLYFHSLPSRAGGMFSR